MKLEDRFWAKVDKIGPCWLWTGATQKSGYGGINIAGRRHLVHRVAYEFVIGPIPDGLEIDHTCGTRNCVNPEHLEVVSHAENMRRGYWTTKTHCRNGHEFTPDNTKIEVGGYRRCLTCRRATDARRRARTT